jgi:hypothetical protein
LFQVVLAGQHAIPGEICTLCSRPVLSHRRNSVASVHESARLISLLRAQGLVYRVRKTNCGRGAQLRRHFVGLAPLTRVLMA